ncbi:MAG: hypothetical protein LBJ14_07430 [Desulfarculales bacterium]|jgi:hypothetical protein|nr:hypothetical protein [Desulfarculales bacterium]
MKLYIASSFKNLHAVHMLRDHLRGRGHGVLDWSALAPPLPEDMPLNTRRALLDSDARGEIFDFCRQACRQADAVIYLGPAGQDAAAEVGIAFASGVKVLGLAGPLEAPGLILSRCVNLWFATAGDLLAHLSQGEK